MQPGSGLSLVVQTQGAASADLVSYGLFLRDTEDSVPITKLVL